MITIEFNYQQLITSIQVNLNDSFENAVNRFISKTELKINEISFISQGRIIKMNDIFDNIMNNIEKQNKKMIILVVPLYINDKVNDKYIIKSNSIICPLCKEQCKFEINNYRIKLYDCINGHYFENISFEEFSNSQNINLSQIICDKCKNQNKGNTHNNEFYKCIDCHMNLCILCQSIHNKSHYIINYDLKNYKCNKHRNELFIKYCKTCKKDICLLCENEHSFHDNVSYSTMIPNLDKIKNKISELRITIDKFKENINSIIKKLNFIMKYFEIFYNINKNLFDDYAKSGIRNFNKLYNIFNVNNYIEKEIMNLREKCNFGNNINELIYIYGEMRNENTEIEMKYNFKKDITNQEKLFSQFLGKEFINNNIYKCKIINDEKIFELSENLLNLFSMGYLENAYEFKFKLRGINNITDMGYMFNGCKEFYSLPDISKINTINITNMKFLFAGCRSMKELPDISIFNTSNVINMECMFTFCSLLTYLPDISKWNISKVFNLSHMFDNCRNLLSLPDISKWNTSNVENMSRMFFQCDKLRSLPNIANWNISKVIYKTNMFNKHCLFYIPYQFKNQQKYK